VAHIHNNLMHLLAKSVGGVERSAHMRFDEWKVDVGGVLRSPQGLSRGSIKLVDRPDHEVIRTRTPSTEDRPKYIYRYVPRT
jgi:hypothetical protein